MNMPVKSVYTVGPLEPDGLMYPQGYRYVVLNLGDVVIAYHTTEQEAQRDAERRTKTAENG
jgi:hypothetical protein